MAGEEVMGDRHEMSREEKIALQVALKREGFYSGPVDGLFGPLTRAAVTAAQEHYALPVEDAVTLPLLTELRIFSTPKGNIMDKVLADVKSAWVSKVNWTLAVGFVFNVAMWLGHPVPDDVQASVYSVGNGLIIVVAWVIKTWFTTSISAASAKKLP